MGDPVRAQEAVPRWLAIAASCAVAVAISTAASDQPQWGRGWSRNMASDERGLADSFDPNTGRNVKWVARLGRETHSTPVIANRRIFIGTNNGEPRDPLHRGDRGVLMCLDESDGRFLWQLVVPKLTTSIYWDWPHAGICSPATVDGNRVYVVSNRGEVLCLDPFGMADGNGGAYRDEGRHAVPAGADPAKISPNDADILWLFDIVRECGIRQHDSAHSSILVYGQHLYVNTSNGVDDSHRKIMAPDAPSLIVLDKNTGRLVATDGERIGPRIFHSTWSSPALGEVRGRKMIIFCGGDGVVYAFEPFGGDDVSAATGRRSAQGIAPPRPTSRVPKLTKIWQFDCDPGAPKEDVHRFHGNRRESPSNIKSMPVFHNNRVYVTVGGDLWWGKRQSWLKCIDATRTGDVTRTGAAWSYPLNRHSMCTPAIYDGMVFVGDSGRRIHCIDADTGEPYWTHDVQGEVWASPLAADGKVYFATRQGEFLVFRASREKRLLSEIELESPISSSPVAANGVLYVTTMTRLYAIQPSAK